MPSSNAIAQKQKTTVAKRFQWKDRMDKLHYVDEMETRHLFYTLRMIWNHTMPAEARSESFHPYRFSSFYTVEYMENAIRAIARELAGRKDMRKEWQDELDNFMRYLSRHRKAIDA